MSLVMKDTGNSDFELIPAGTHLARCYLMADLGDQKVTYQGLDKIQHKVLISWELVNEKMKDGRPFVISKTYTASLNEKATLRAHLESWRSRAFSEDEAKEFDLKKVLGAPCQLSIVHDDRNGKTYANIKAVTSVPKGVTVAELHNQKVAYEIHDEIAWAKLPEWVQKRINERVQEEKKAEFVDDDMSSIDAIASRDGDF